MKQQPTPKGIVDLGKASRKTLGVLQGTRSEGAGYYPIGISDR